MSNLLQKLDQFNAKVNPSCNKYDFEPKIIKLLCIKYDRTDTKGRKEGNLPNSSYFEASCFIFFKISVEL